MNQRPVIRKHGGGMMTLVIVFTVSAPLSAGGQLAVTDVERGIRKK